MSAEATDAVPAGKGKKKLLIMVIGAVLVLALGGGGAAVFLMKKNAAEAAAAEEDGDDEEHASAETHHKVDPKHVPTFVPLDPFTVNLADAQAERYAQVGITLEVPDAKTGDTLKSYMPAIRNNILMLLAQKTSTQLLDRKGKERLAAEIRREAVKPLGYTIELEPEEAEDAASAADEEEKPKKKKKKKAHAGEDLPVSAVHFSNFIIQ